MTGLTVGAMAGLVAKAILAAKLGVRHADGDRLQYIIEQTLAGRTLADAPIDAGTLLNLPESPDLGGADINMGYEAAVDYCDALRIAQPVHLRSIVAAAIQECDRYRASPPDLSREPAGMEARIEAFRKAYYAHQWGGLECERCGERGILDDAAIREALAAADRLSREPDDYDGPLTAQEIAAAFLCLHPSEDRAGAEFEYIQNFGKDPVTVRELVVARSLNGGAQVIDTRNLRRCISCDTDLHTSLISECDTCWRKHYVQDVADRDDVMDWDNRDDIYRAGFDAGYNRALDGVRKRSLSQP